MNLKVKIGSRRYSLPDSMPYDAADAMVQLRHQASVEVVPGNVEELLLTVVAATLGPRAAKACLTRGKTETLRVVRLLADQYQFRLASGGTPSR